MSLVFFMKSSHISRWNPLQCSLWLSRVTFWAATFLSSWLSSTFGKVLYLHSSISRRDWRWANSDSYDFADLKQDFEVGIQRRDLDIYCSDQHQIRKSCDSQIIFFGKQASSSREQTCAPKTASPLRWTIYGPFFLAASRSPFWFNPFSLPFHCCG